MREERVETARGPFAIRFAGEADAPLVVALHGFPDDAGTFEALGTALSREGLRVAAPFLRGYAPSPLDGSLTLADLAADLLALLDALSPRAPVRFVGHDYGAQVGYVAMTRAPRRFRAAVMLAGAHPAVIARNMRRHPRQWWMSRYILFFQLGPIADRSFASGDFAAIERLWKRWSPGWAIPRDRLDRVKETFRRSMPAPLAMYRAGGFDVPADPIAVPTLLVSGREDGCLLPDLAEGQERLFPGGYGSEVWDGVGHFPHLEAPDRALDRVRSWFAAHP